MGGIASTIGGIFGQTAAAFTPQNSYQANNGGQNLSALLSGSQANLAQNQAGESGLATQLQAQANGQGPNPAQMQLQNALTQNQAQAAGQEASQKGINPGLAQKQIATNSANQAQQAAGQGALMGAQQQIAAQGQLGGLYGNMANQNLTNQGQYEGVLNAENGVNAATSAQNAAAVQNTNSGLMQGVAGGIGAVLYKGGEIKKYADGGQVNPNDPDKAKQVSSTFQPNSTDQAIAHPIDTISKYFADGGSVDYNNNDPVDWTNSDDNHAAQMGVTPAATPGTPAVAAPAAASSGGSPFLQGLTGGKGAQSKAAAPAVSASSQIANQITAGAGMPSYANGVTPLNTSGMFAKKPMGSSPGQTLVGGPMDQTTSPLDQIQSNPMGTPGAQEMVAAHGGMVPPTSIFHPSHPIMAALKAKGGPVPGQAQVPGDSPQNDTVPAVLSPKEIVLPRSVTLSDNPGDSAKSFVEQIKGKSKGKEGYAKVLEAKRKAM
jgi:hypothetical protein